MKTLYIKLFVIIFALTDQPLNAQLIWPISNSNNDNADVVTSAFGPRILDSFGTNFDLHYGLDLNKPNGGQGDQIYAPVTLEIIDARHGGSEAGNILEVKFFDGESGMVSRLKFLHLDQIPNVSAGQIFTIGQAIPGAFVGSSGSVSVAHLHLEYFPSDLPNQDPKIDTENPIQLLPYEYKDTHGFTNPYSTSDPQIETDGQDTWFSFTAFIPSKRLDLTRIEVSFNGFDKQGQPHSQDDESGSFFDPIIESESKFTYPNILQEIGIIDFHQRIGLDIQSENNTFNGVKIEPAELNNFSGSGYQPNDHYYKISFKLDNRVLREILVGGLYNVTAELTSVDLAGHGPDQFTFDSDDIAVQWQQEWMANTIFPSSTTVSNYHIRDGGNVLILNQNSSETNSPQLNSGQTLYVDSGGTLELQDGTENNRTWFRNSGTINLVNGGLFVQGEHSRFKFSGTFHVDNASEVDYRTGAEFINEGTSNFEGFVALNQPESCIIPMTGSVTHFHKDVTLENGAFIMTWSEDSKVIVDGNITAKGSGNNNGNVIELIEGTEVVMGFNKRIIIEDDARMKAVGTASKPITFTYKYPQEFPDAAWDRIQLFGDGNRFEYVIFEYGLSPLDVRSRDNLITHSTFRNNKHGIDSWKQPSGTRSQFRVLESAFDSHTSLALRARHADASIEHSRFTNEVWNGGGIYVYASTLGNPGSSGGYFRRNEITNNRSHGLRLDVSAIVYDGFGSVRGGNLIYGNDKHEIFLSSSTTRLWTSTGGAHSNIHSSDSYKYIYNLAQTTSGEELVSWTVPVENNWWGSSSGPSSTDFFGSVDYSPWLSTPTYQQGGPTTPPPSSIEGDGEQQMTLQPAMSAAMAQAVTAEAESLPEKERLLWVEQRLGELKELWLNGERDEWRARWLNGMVSLWQELPPGRRQAHEDIPGYVSQSLELLMNEPRMDLLAGQDPKAAKSTRLTGEAAMLAEMNRHLEEDEPRQALFLDEQYRPYLQNLDHRRERLLLLAVAAHEDLGQYGQALALLDPLRELAREGIDPEGAALDFTELEQMLSERLEEEGRSPEEAKELAAPVVEATGQAVDNAGSGLPESFEIKPAYPNPFNPSTQIVFALPERGEVRIRVYDITGRLVSVLANQTFDAGRHQLTFDAGRLASGVYLIRGNAAGEVFTQRVTLIK